MLQISLRTDDYGFVHLILSNGQISCDCGAFDWRKWLENKEKQEKEHGV